MESLCVNYGGHSKGENMKRKLIGIRDLYKIKFLREIALSPCGKKIAYTAEWMDKKNNKYYSNLYLVSEDGKHHHFIRGNKNIKTPKWSPNGKFISFILTEKQKQNIWFIPANGGEAYALTDANGFFGNYQWTPDSKFIICDFLQKNEDKERIPEKGKPPFYYHIKDVFYKLDNWGMLPEEKNHIWKVNVQSGKMTQLTFGKNGDYSPSIYPDGKKIVLVSNRNKNWEEKIGYVDIFVIDINGQNEKKIKTPAGFKDKPIFSPDGRYIVYTGRECPDEIVGWRNQYLWKVPLRSGKAINLTKSLGRSSFDMVIDDLGHHANHDHVFSKDGRFIYFLATDQGDTSLYRVDVKKRKVTKILGNDERVYAFNYDGKDTFALAISNPVDPGNLYTFKNNNIKKITDLNKKYFKTHRVSKPEEFRFKGDQGDEIQAWILKPPNFRKNKRYPLIVEIHGGPHMSYGNSFFHEFQVLAANGYVVFYSNPHGSQGYGEKFAKALHNRWGIPDTKDLKKALKLLTKRKYINKNRMGVMGGSYGGFMTNWLIGHTNIFKVAVTMRSVVSSFTQFASDYGFLRHKQFKGKWWERNNFQYYWEKSPLKYVKRMKTPLLIIHSEQDHRCPIIQAEQLFVALKLLKRDVEMVRFPIDGHELSRHGTPRRREKRLEFILEFIDRYLKK
jgi:dipeptidyl aminopeptidase/acylaminoacyl peptidase